MTKRIAILARPQWLAPRAFESARRAGARHPGNRLLRKQSDWGGMWNYVAHHTRQVRRAGAAACSAVVQRPQGVHKFADYSFEEHFDPQIPPTRRAKCCRTTSWAGGRGNIAAHPLPTAVLGGVVPETRKARSP